MLTKLAGGGDSVAMPSVQLVALRQQLAWLTATEADHETAILELWRQVAVAETVERRVRDVETFVAVVDKLETRVGEMEQLKVQLEQLSDLVKVTQLVVEEFGEKLQKRSRDMEKSSVLEEVRQLVVGESGEKLQKRSRDAETQLESRVTNLEQWGEGIAESLNAFQDRVENLEHRW